MEKKRKKRNLNQAGTMDVDAWRRRQITKRVEKRIEDETNEYEQRYGQAEDQELIDLVRCKADELGRMPHPLEIPGGVYIRKRLGSWKKLAAQIGRVPVGAGPGLKAYESIEKEESERFAAERRALKEEKLRRRADAEENGKN